MEYVAILYKAMLMMKKSKYMQLSFNIFLSWMRFVELEMSNLEPTWLAKD
jgi:hypothetical protein